MAVYYKPQSPIQSGEDFIYPITTADQIMKSDNSRRLEQAGLIVADNSTSLGGVAASGYALKTDTAPDSNKLGGVAAIDYALKTDTAPDSNKLGGKAPEYYIQPRNLLDNSDFRNPVNQRGQTSYTVSEYTIDRWYISGGSCTIENGNGVIVSSLDDPKMTFMQFLKNIDVEKVYTFAIKDIDGNVYLIRSTPGERIEEDTSFGTIIAKTLPGDITFAITISAANSKKFIWAALYEGSYTADTLPPYVPKGYTAELTACNSAPVDLGGGYGGGSLQAYPVGSIYMSVSDTSPASLFGGTWEILNDVFLLAAGSYANAGTFGGEATHTLTLNELPAHTHTATVYGISSGNYTANAAKLVYKDNTTTGWISEGLSWVNSTGGSQSHNNMPPYLAVYMWKRVS